MRRNGTRHFKLRATPQMSRSCVFQVDRYAENARWVAEQRLRLSSLSWLMRLVKQDMSRRANVEDGCAGHFWEKRFTSVAVLDW